MQPATSKTPIVARVDDDQQTTYTGTLDAWFPDRAFGFIRRDCAFGFSSSNRQPGLFVHLHGIRAHPSEIHEGLRVEYQIGTGSDNRLKAINVKILPAGED